MQECLACEEIGRVGEEEAPVSVEGGRIALREGLEAGEGVEPHLSGVESAKSDFGELIRCRIKEETYLRSSLLSSSSDSDTTVDALEVLLVCLALAFSGLGGANAPITPKASALEVVLPLSGAGLAVPSAPGRRYVQYSMIETYTAMDSAGGGDTLLKTALRIRREVEMSRRALLEGEGFDLNGARARVMVERIEV
jgi:hypothetical protein